MWHKFSNQATVFHGSAAQFWPAEPAMDFVSSPFLELFYWIRQPSPSLPTSTDGPWSPTTPSPQPWVCSAELGGELVQPGRGGGRRLRWTYEGLEVSPTMLVALGVRRGKEKGSAVISFTSCQRLKQLMVVNSVHFFNSICYYIVNIAPGHLGRGVFWGVQAPYSIQSVFRMQIVTRPVDTLTFSCGYRWWTLLACSQISWKWCEMACKVHLKAE